MAKLITILAKLVVLANMLSAIKVINRNHTDMIKEVDILKETGYILNKDSEAAVEERRKDIDTIDRSVSTGTFFNHFNFFTGRTVQSDPKWTVKIN